MDDKELDKKIEEMKAASDSLKKEMEQWEKLYTTMGLSGTELKKKLVQLGTTTDETRKLFKKSADSLAEDILKLDKQFKNQTLTAKDLEEELEYLRKQVNNTADQTKKAALQDAKSHLEEAAARNKATELFKTSMGELSGTVVKGLANSFTGAAKSALRGGDALTVATEFMSSNIDMANSASQVGSKALTDFGASTVGAGGKIGKFGIAASVAGSALSFLSSNVSELAKAGIGFMMSQTQKLIGGFQQLSSVGAVFAGGMQEMTNTALDGRMTLEQFSKAVSENKDQLTALGMGLGEGSKRMVAAMKAGGDGTRNALFSLGMSVEEQAGTFASVMAQMAGPSGQLKASNEEVARRTEQYAANLKLLSDLTGEDMKAKQETIRQENDNLAFQQQLDGMDEKQRLDIQESMKGMSESQRKALRENMIYGTVISKDVAIAQATNSGLQQTNDAFARMAKDGTLNIDNTLKVQGENSDLMHQQAMGNKALAMAGLAGGADAAKAAADQLKTDQLTRKLQTASTDAERKKILEQMQAGKEGKRDEVTLQNVQQDFAVQMQQIARDNLPEFSKAVTSTIESIKGSVQELSKMGIGAGTSSPFMTALTGIGSAALQIAPLALQLKGAGAGAAAGSAGGGIMSSVKGFFGGGGGAATGMAESGMLKGASKVLGKAGGPVGALLGLGMAASDYSDISKKESTGKITAADATKAKGGVVGEAGGGLAGGLAGAASGAAMGALLGPIGAAVGGIVGGIAGGFGGGKLGKMGGEAIGGMIADKPSGTTVAPRTPDVAQHIASRQQELANMNDKAKMEAIKSEIMGTSGPKTDDHMAKMVDLLKSQNDLMSQSIAKYDQMTKVMDDHKDITQRLMHNMS